MLWGGKDKDRISGLAKETWKFGNVKVENRDRIYGGLGIQYPGRYSSQFIFIFHNSKAGRGF